MDGWRGVGNGSGSSVFTFDSDFECIVGLVETRTLDFRQQPRDSGR